MKKELSFFFALKRNTKMKKKAIFLFFFFHFSHKIENQQKVIFKF